MLKKKFAIVFLLVLCFVFPLFLIDSLSPQQAWAAPPDAPQDDPPRTVILANGYQITFLGVTYNADHTSTWHYEVEELPWAQDLSNWVLELFPCHQVITATPDSWWLENPDPNTGLNGIKWQGAGVNQVAEFSVTLANYWVVGANQVAAKGPDVAAGLIAGPSCNEDVIDLQKTVTPAVAQPGDVLTYTVIMQNISNAALVNVVLTDTIPLSTTYVNLSLNANTGSAQYLADEDLIY